MTVMNFIGLAEGTLKHSREGSKKFYDGLTFHRVEPGFVIQGGDPLGSGAGGPGYAFPDEFDKSLRHDGPGIISMANSGVNTNGSQFFITLTDTPWLDDRHSVFGKVVKGEEVLAKIEAGDKIKSIRIIRKGSEAKAFKADQESFDAAVKAAFEKADIAYREKLEEDLQTIFSTWPNVVLSDEGLLYVVQKEGKGDKKPDIGTIVKAHYTVHFLDGEMFDSSYERGEPAEFLVGQLLPGLNYAFMAMKKGEKRTVIIPPELAYGDQGYPGLIPPNAFLIFDVEIVDF